MKTLGIIVTLLVVTTGSSAFQDGLIPGGGGMFYRIIKHGDGTLIKPDDIVYFNATLKTETGLVISTSYDGNIPGSLRLPRVFSKGDLPSAFQLLREGDSALVKLNLDTLYKRSIQSKPVGLGNYFVYSVKIEKVISREKNEQESLFRKRAADYLKTLTDKARDEEPTRIERYIANQKLKVTTTQSGLKYTITHVGAGPKAVAGDTVVLNYTGMLLDGRVFDTNIEAVAKETRIFMQTRSYGPTKYFLANNNTMPGWDEGLRLLSKGARATFIVPSGLAYGEHGGGLIGPYVTLVFDIQVIGIKKK